MIVYDVMIIGRKNNVVYTALYVHMFIHCSLMYLHSWSETVFLYFFGFDRLLASYKITKVSIS